ncbi:MAG: radical SAM protein [Chloroflexi bacterium]|nr:radical SAM protein [Chloroflexota bacterium]
MPKTISPYTHIIKVKDDVYALFNSLWLRVIFVDGDLLPFIYALMRNEPPKKSLSLLAANFREEGQSLFQQMELQKFMSPESDEIKLDQIRELLDEQKISIMYLIMTSNCNLACTYCYLSEALYQNKLEDMDMVTDTIRKAIDMFAGLVKRGEVEKPEIIFYGGEPLLNIVALEFALKYASTTIPNCSFTMNTNGTLVDEPSAKLLKRFDVEVGLSIDGPENVHDKLRIDRGGKGTFSRAITGYKKLKENGVNVGISCTITPANVGHLAEVTTWLINDLGIESLGFNLMIGEEADSGIVDDYTNSAAKALMDSFEIAKEAGVYEERVMRRVNALSDGQVSLNDCGGCGQQVVITPDNQIGVCQAFMNTGENFFPFNEVENPSNHELWKKWRKRSPFNIPECLDCEALGMCGGGCPYNSLIRYGDFMAPDLVHCAHVKETLHFLLGDLWELSLEA